MHLGDEEEWRICLNLAKTLKSSTSWTFGLVIRIACSQTLYFHIFSVWGLPRSFIQLENTIHITCGNLICCQENARYLSVKVFSVKVLLNWGHYFYVFNWRRDRHFTWSSEPREGLAACSAKGVLSFFSYFKTLSIGPTPVIEPATFRSAVERSTDWANPAAVEDWFERAW